MNIDGMIYYSQFFQDYFLNKEIFKNKLNGTFIEFGAWDGIDKSNTYFFEKEMNWAGTCIEPIPGMFNKLKENRKCECLFGAIVPENIVQTDFLLNTGHNGMNSGIKGLVEEFRLKIFTTIQVPTFNLNDILEKYDEIDYLSIDIDGGEFEIIKSIDFESNKINVITIENCNNNLTVYDYMLTNNYKYFGRLFVDDIYLRKQ